MIHLQFFLLYINIAWWKIMTFFGHTAKLVGSQFSNWAQLAIIRQMSGQMLRGSAGE